MHSYTFSKYADVDAFEAACTCVESLDGGVSIDIHIEDVDGTQIRLYRFRGTKIKVCNDYEIDAVYVDSLLDLAMISPLKEWRVYEIGGIKALLNGKR